MTTFVRLLSVLSLLLSGWANAYGIKPMVAELTPSGKTSQLSMTIQNNNTKPITIEIFPLKLSINASGEENLSPADSDLLVLPVTAIVQPGQFQSVIVRYIGAPEIQQSQAYRIAFEQANVALDENQGPGIGLKFNISTLLNVKPAEAKADLRIEKIYRDGEQWKLTIENRGSSYARLSEADWQINTPDRQLTLSDKEVRAHVDGNLILPHSTRTFAFSPFGDINPEKMTITLAMP
ncbi:molecular chaperone [Thaumasiovibrio subtropicus]|uniref:molecular chaperone n=1 Tax=Thaumasiovibrio subtropicus TaxID=1891207 RepID=UPI000B359049|nr:molecular chaperone [Thaumasiovibrio subtropicus]